MLDRKYYVICGQNCKFESMTKEQILTAIEQAVKNGEIKDVDTGFVTTIKTVNNKGLRFFVGEQSEYEALSKSDKQNLFALITNDTTREALLETLESLKKESEGLQTNIQSLENWKTEFTTEDGKTAKHARSATNAWEAEHLKSTPKLGTIMDEDTTAYASVYLDANCAYLVQWQDYMAVLCVSDNSISIARVTRPLFGGEGGTWSGFSEYYMCYKYESKRFTIVNEKFEVVRLRTVAPKFMKIAEFKE